MKRFRFPLARLERLRNHHERDAKRRLAAALGVVNELRSHLLTVEQNLEVCAEEVGSGVALQRAMSEGLNQVKKRLTAELVDADAVANAALEIYQAKRKDRRVLTNLREKRFDAWKTETLATEQAELEELATMQSSAKRRNGGRL